MKCYLCKNTKTVKYNLLKTKNTWHCNNCDLLFVSGNDSISYKSFFKDKRVHEQTLNNLRKEQYKIDYLHFSRFLKKGSVLDVGCSNGEFISHFNKANYHCDGIDIDSSAINIAKKRFTNTTFLNTSLSNLDSKTRYDGIVFRGTLQYLGCNLYSEFNKAKSLLKKNGIITIYSLPNKDSFMFYLLREKWNLFNPNEHKLFFNEKSIEKLAEVFKLELLEISYPYINTAYSNAFKDYNILIDMIKSNNIKNMPFWGNIIQVVLQKNNELE
jgi:SAM-dependent methyltransferase